MFGVLIFVLNEAKFLRLCVENYLQSPWVKEVIVVEGADRLMPKGSATADGFSVDDTSEVAKGLAAQHDRVRYVPLGWATGKAHLQNAGIAGFSRTWPYLWLSGSDEFYQPRVWERLALHLREAKHVSVVCPTFVHLWRRPDVRGIGGSWQTRMHRGYRWSACGGLTFMHHASPPFSKTGGRQCVSALGTQSQPDWLVCYHAVGLHDLVDVRRKMEYYQKRDGQRIPVYKAMWENWEWGKATQWTSATASGAARFDDSELPPLLRERVWDLLPEGVPLPGVPWERGSEYREVKYMARPQE